MKFILTIEWVNVAWILDIGDDIILRIVNFKINDRKSKFT